MSLSHALGHYSVTHTNYSLSCPQPVLHEVHPAHIALLVPEPAWLNLPHAGLYLVPNAIY